MIVFRRRLFWKVYLTLLASLVAVAVLMGPFWRAVGETSHERLGAFRIHLSDQMIPQRDEPPGALAQAVGRLGDEIGADISVYDPQGRLIASRGPLDRPGAAGAQSPRHTARESSGSTFPTAAPCWRARARPAPIRDCALSR